MKKFLIFVVLVVAGYFAYDTFFKEKDLVEIKASYSKSREAVSIDAPSIQPRDFANYQGTVKNISDETLSNIVITYLIDAKPSTATIEKLEPGEEKNFTTAVVMLSNMDPGHYLKDVTYDGK